MTVKNFNYGGSGVFLKKSKYLLLQSDGLFVLDRGLHRRESAAKALKRLCMAC